VVLAGVVLYAALDTALVFLRPQFSILHSAESDYGSIGSWDWLMDLNFLLRGALSLAAVRAIALVAPDPQDARMLLGLRLLRIWAAASALLAFFPDDPAGTRVKWHGDVHLVLALIAFLCVLVGTIAVSGALRSVPRFARAAHGLTALAWAALIPLLLLGHSHLRHRSLGGLYEKLFLGIELIWLLVAALAAAGYSAACRPSQAGSISSVNARIQ
jgi:hypothetical protein